MNLYFVERFDKEGIRFSLVSKREAVSSACDLVRGFLGSYQTGQSPNLDVVLREMLLNAVMHGNKLNPGAYVRCAIEYMERDQVRITVEDGGDGFDYRSLDMRLPDEPKCTCRRGFPLINALADHLEFNEKGNQATAFVTLREPIDSQR